MGYFLRQDKKKKGVYLQIYETYWDKDKKQARTRSIEKIGYVCDLVSDELPDPVAHYKDVVKQMEANRVAEVVRTTRASAFDTCQEKNVGCFLLSTLLEELEVKDVIDILASTRNFQFSIYDMIHQLIIARVVYPCSKSKTVSSVFPTLYRNIEMSEDQVYEGLNFIGESYKKYIELFNHQYEQHFKRDFSHVYFDCTNYYFEIDLPKEDKQKGKSKENRHEPIIGQALLLDGDLVPLAMQMYPGNNSEKPYIRGVIEEMKQRYKVEGRTVQVADKGLNCARNIYSAVKEANDGYIFSKSIHGTGLSAAEKEWLLLENDKNVFTDFRDENGKIRFRLKSCIDTYEYSFEEIDPVTSKKKTVRFEVKELRIVSYTPALAKKQKAEIKKMADKAANYTTFKKYAKGDLGATSKYVKETAFDKDGNTVTPAYTLDENAIEEDLKYAGYNLLVTSELSMNPLDVYKTYHNLWKIEECFRITKSFLDGRPVYCQKKESIYGHFLICYLSLFLLRVMEIKCFNDEINSYDLIQFIRDFRVVKRDNRTYINISKNQSVNEKIKSLTGLTNLDALYLTQKEIDNLFDSTMLIST